MAKRITIVTSAYPPEKGAAPVRVYNLATMLHKAGHEVTVISAMPNYPTGKIFSAYKRKWRHKEVLDGITVYRTWLYPSNSKNIFKRIASLFSFSASSGSFIYTYLKNEKPDYVIVNTPPLLPGYVSLSLAWKAGCKTILNISDLWPLSALELGAIKKGTAYGMLEKIEQRMYHLADAHVGQSKEIQSHISTITPGKPFFLYYNLQQPAYAKEQRLPGAGRKIVYAGLLGVAQGVYEICQAIDFSSLGVSLHIYGDGYEKEKIKKFIASHPDRGIYLHPTVPAAEMPTLLGEYHATLIPLKTSIQGALPSKIFMAFANNLPVFFSGNGEGSLLVKENKAGWVNAAGDYNALQENIRTFSKLTEAEYETISTNCRNAMQHNFNKEQQDAAFLDFISHL